MPATTEPRLPKFFRLQQKLRSFSIEDIPSAVRQQLPADRLAHRIHPGQTVALAVGSRGIRDLDVIVAEVVRALQEIKAIPFIVPAMGSHGGATAEGQIQVLASHGVTESKMGCAIRASMETITVAENVIEGCPVMFDEAASHADHIIVINRIKPHTRLVGSIQSGLCKMLMIGLGKHAGALRYHQVFTQYDHRFEEIASAVVPEINAQLPIRLGLAIVEDAFDQCSHIEAIEPTDFLSREPELLRMATERMPAIPFQRADLLIVDQIGKEISGTGMDTNVIGRKANDRQATLDEFPKIDQIYVRSLTESTKGNATGIGIAEYCHRRILDSIDYEAVRINCVTSAHVSAGAIPIHFDSDREVMCAAANQARNRNAPRWLRIRDTLHLSEFWASEAFYEQSQVDPLLNPLSEPQALKFDDLGDLHP